MNRQLFTKKYMLKMCLNTTGILRNQEGVGLITAIFVIVVVGMFGVLIARFAMISSMSSTEDYFWAQALYSAQSSAQIAILYGDGGGIGASSLTQVAGFDVNSISISSGFGVRAEASKSINNRPVQRTIEVYITQ